MKPGFFDPLKFNLKPGHFDHESRLHGINHTYRVMCHTLILGQALNLKREMRLAFCSAFIHDMSRKHDGFCTMHGLWASERKLPVFAEFFISQGISEYELEEIRTAVRNHSENFEIEKQNPFRKTAALLKDADALDRVRLGRGNLDPAFLRFEPSISILPFSQELFQQTEWKSNHSFNDILAIAVENRGTLPEEFREIDFTF